VKVPPGGACLRCTKPLLEQALPEGGHFEVSRILETWKFCQKRGWTGACQKEARALVTLDLDFSDIRAYPPEDYQGIIVFHPALQNITTLVQLSTRIIALLNQEPLIGHLWIVEDHQVRIREGSQGGTRVR
jgi:hypothetical protein